MKKAFLIALASTLLPFGAAFAGSTFYAKLTASKASASTGAGKVYVATSNATPSDSDYAESSSATGSGTGQNSATVTFYIYASPETGSEFAGWTAGSGVKVTDASKASTTATISTSNKTSPGVLGTVTATFNIIKVAGFKVLFSAPQNGSYTVDETSVGSGGLTSAEYTGTYAPTLIATPSSGYVLDGWYESTDGGATKTLKSRSATYNPEYLAATTVYAEFVPVVTVTTLETLTTSLANNACTEIPSGTTIAIPSGTTVTVGEGKQLVVNGQFDVFGTLTNNGVIGGSGKIVTVKKTITQTGNPDGTPIVTETTLSSYQKKYYTTTLATASGTVSGTTPGCTVLNGAQIVRGGSQVAIATYPTSITSPILACSIDSSKAVNHITGVLATSYYENVSKGMAAVQNKATTQMLILTADATVGQTDANTAGILNSDSKLNGNFGTIDLAGKTLTVSTSKINSYSHILLNGALNEKTLLYGGTITCINCSAVTFATVAPKYASNINLYDCTITASKLPTKYDTSASGSSSNAINFYSSRDSDYSTGKFQTDTTHYHIYGGKWTTKPADSFIASVLAAEYGFYQTEGASTYELQPKANREVVTLGTGEQYESFDEAANALEAKFASADSVTMTMVKNASLATPITIPSGKTLEVELDGCCITAANGFAINHGTLILGDDKANLASTGGRIVTTSGNFITNDGTVDITYGYYTGNMVLNGGTFTTHHGYFTGSVSGSKDYADLRGGYFTQDVSAFLQTGYVRQSGYVGKYPVPEITKTWSSDHWNVTMKTLSASDLSLYNSTSNLKSGYTLENWKRRAEVLSSTIPWVNNMVDIVVGFDRDIAKESASAVVTKPFGITEKLSADVEAGGVFRVLSPYMTSQGSYQVKYTRFLTETTFQTTSFGITTSVAANNGTTANLRVELCSGTDAKPQSLYALMSENVVLGAGKTNQAMIQPESGAATFYSTIAAAVEAAKAGDTIKLCNDIESTEAITVSKSCTIDTNGMTFKGSIVAGQGYAVSSQTTTLQVEKMLGKVHTTYQIVKTIPVEPIVTPTAGEKVTVAVAVPFVNATVANLLDTTQLKEGDELKAYIGGKYEFWAINTDGGAWQPRTTIMSGVSSTAPDPATTSLARGSAVWVTTSGAIVLQGVPDSSMETVEPAVTEEFNLLGNPTTAEYAVPVPEEATTNDQVVAMHELARYKIVEVNEQKVWQSSKTVREHDAILNMYIDREVRTDNDPPTIPAGKAYWYIRKSSAK